MAKDQSLSTQVSVCGSVQYVSWRQCACVSLCWVVHVLLGWLPAVLYRCEWQRQKRKAGGWFTLTFSTNPHIQTYMFFFCSRTCTHTCCCVCVCLAEFVDYGHVHMGIQYIVCMCSCCGCWLMRVPTISWVLERRGELLGGDPRHATLLLGFLSCSYRCLRFTLCMSRPDIQKTGNRSHTVQ